METGLRGAPIGASAHARAYSFDIFDTFLLRACTTPDGVYERAFQLALGDRLPPEAALSYVQHRIQAEARARAAAQETRKTIEVGIEDIYALFPFRLFGLDRMALQDLADAEFQAALELCRANLEVSKLYRTAQQDRQKVGFISDTYWSSEQLGMLLRHCAPGLTWDFLFASCEHGTGKSDKLFTRYLAGQGLDPSQATHIGDNPHADIKGARRHGIRTRFYPQATGSMFAQFQREDAAYQTLCLRHHSRLDAGARTLRRIVAANTPRRSPGFTLGVTTLGPVMNAFDAFIERKLAQLRREGSTVQVAFLGRDGFLPHRIWSQPQHQAGFYIEINRRVSLIASATTIEPLVDLFKKIDSTKIDAATFEKIVKVLPDPVFQFFLRYRDGIATAKELAEALPTLLDQQQIARIAAATRAALLGYLRRQIPNFDTCTDLMLVDLGYSGSVQKSLRRIFDYEGINIRLHGTYLLSLDDSYDDIDPDDTVSGFISDLTVSPHVKRMLLRNVAPLEQICCSDEGSVRDYRKSKVYREADLRSSEQLALVREIQSGAMAFVDAAREHARHYRLEPFSDITPSANWSAAILGRLLLLPSDSELTLLGKLQHDVNLGTTTMAPMLDSKTLLQLETARGLPIACTAPAPPMWLAGSFNDITPAMGYLYALFGANRLPGDIFGDVKCGNIGIGLFGKDGSSAMEHVAVYRNGMGDLRIRIPLTRAMKLETIAIPIAQIAREGILRGIYAQYGKSVQQAAANAQPEQLSADRMIAAGLDLSGKYYRAGNEDGCLLVKPGHLKSDAMILTVGISPLDATLSPRVEGNDEFEDALKADLLDPSPDNTTAQ